MYFIIGQWVGSSKEDVFARISDKNLAFEMRKRILQENKDSLVVWVAEVIKDAEV